MASISLNQLSTTTIRETKFISTKQCHSAYWRIIHIPELLSKGEKYKRRRFLYQEELDKIRNAEIPNESIRRVRDLFVFQSFTGLAYADLAKFNFKRDVVQHEGKYIIYDMRIKTEEDYYIVLLSPALEVLKK